MKKKKKPGQQSRKPQKSSQGSQPHAPATPSPAASQPVTKDIRENKNDSNPVAAPKEAEPVTTIPAPKVEPKAEPKAKDEAPVRAWSAPVDYFSASASQLYDSDTRTDRSASAADSSHKGDNSGSASDSAPSKSFAKDEGEVYYNSFMDMTPAQGMAKLNAEMETYLTQQKTKANDTRSAPASEAKPQIRVEPARKDPAAPASIEDLEDTIPPDDASTGTLAQTAPEPETTPAAEPELPQEPPAPPPAPAPEPVTEPVTEPEPAPEPEPAAAPTPAPAAPAETPAESPSQSQPTQRILKRFQNKQQQPADTKESQEIHAFDGKEPVRIEPAQTAVDMPTPPSNWHHPSEPEALEKKKEAERKKKAWEIDEEDDEDWHPVTEEEVKKTDKKTDRIAAILKTPVEGFKSLPKYGSEPIGVEEESRFGALAHPMSEQVHARPDPTDRTKSIQRLKTKTTARNRFEAYTIIFCCCLVVGYLTQRAADPALSARIEKAGAEVETAGEQLLPPNAFESMRSGLDWYEQQAAKIAALRQVDLGTILDAIAKPMAGERKRTWYRELPGLILAPVVAACYMVYQLYLTAQTGHTMPVFVITSLLYLSAMLMGLIISLKMGIIRNNRTWLNLLAPVYVFFIGSLLMVPIEAIISFANALLGGPMGQTVKLTSIIAIIVCILDTARHAFVGAPPPEQDPNY